MANLVRVRVGWSGDPVTGDGVSTFFFDEAHSGFLADLSTFFHAIRFTVPTGVAWTFPNSGDLIDVATGELSGTWSEVGEAPRFSGGSGGHAQGVGCRITWATSGIRNGRRVRGSTFIVPLTNTSYASDGTIDDTVVAALDDAADAFRTAAATNLRIYSRPMPGAAGQANTVVGHAVPDKVSWLRSRRV